MASGAGEGRSAERGPTSCHADPARLQRRRRLLQLGFFLFFVSAPALNLLRFDLNETQLWVLGQPWSLGLDAFRAGQASALQTGVNIFVRAFLPAIVLIVGFLALAWRYGRLYCGWLCPHFSAVETLNDLLHRAIGKLSIWDRQRVARPGREPDARWWPVFGLACVLMGFTWAITLLSYLLPPVEIWGNLLRGESTPNQARFLIIGTLVFSAEFAFARHLFCRFGCAVGLFQSLAWMANPRGMVVAFSRERARDCRSCQIVRPGTSLEAPAAADDRVVPLRPASACDAVCPMRLHPRDIKRMMFSCVQCGQCLQACDASQGSRGREPLLEWRVGLDAVRETLRARRAEAGQDAEATGDAGRRGAGGG